MQTIKWSGTSVELRRETKMQRDFLKNLVLDLVNKRKEGEWWDFKEKHHRCLGELIKDIVSMHNRLSNEDAYILFGIKDGTFEVVGVEKDEKRRKQADVINILKNVPFSGEFRPDISLDTIEIDNHQVDVLTIHHSNNVPIFMSKPYKPKGTELTLYPGCVYTRVGDENEMADYHLIESLWEKRLGLVGDVLDKLNAVLDDYGNWNEDWGNKRYAYSKKHPEFQLSLVGDYMSGYEPIQLFYLAPTFYHQKLNVLYHNTILYETVMWVLDDHRLYIPAADISSVNNKDGKSYYFYYYLRNSIEGKILKINTNGTSDLSTRYPLKTNPILIFDDEADLNEFKLYYETIIDDIDWKEVFERLEIVCACHNEEKIGGTLFTPKHIGLAHEAYVRWRIEKDKLQNPKGLAALAD